MAYNYTTYVTALRTMIVSQDPDPAFDAILPSIIDYAEQRIYRELDLISTITRDTSGETVAGTREFALTPTVVVVNEINVVIPPGSTIGNGGTRHPLAPVSLPYIDAVWPDTSYTAVPDNFAMIDQWTLAFGPAPDDAYQVEVVGTIRPAPLSATNQNTFLTDHLPDLFMAASMIFASGYMRNFGSQADDPQMGMSWEAQYGKLLSSAETEEARKKWQSVSWSSQSPQPLANPPRG